MNTRNKYALITGASSGIGAAFASHAAKLGFDVGLCARREHRLQALAEQLRDKYNVQADVFCTDLGLPDSGLNLAKQIQAAGRNVDVLVNNAGFSIACGFAASDYQRQRAFIELSVHTPTALAHAFLPFMLEQGWGRILNISSITALSSGGKGHTLYPAAKAFLLKFSQSLAAEVADRGVLVSAILPGFVATEFQQANGIEEKAMQGAACFTQSAETMVNEAWRRNNKGVEIIVPGLAAKIMAMALTILPEKLVRTLTRPLAARAFVDD